VEIVFNILSVLLKVKNVKHPESRLVYTATYRETRIAAVYNA